MGRSLASILLLPQLRRGMSAPASLAQSLGSHPVSHAPLEERQLYGVARWPRVFSETDAEENNFEYGLAFAEESLRLGHRIRQEKYSHFVYLWKDCREWRAAYEMKFGGKDASFGESRIGASKVYRTPIMSYERYAYVAQRIAAIPLAQRSFLTGQINWPKTAVPLQISHTATTTLGGRERRLTELRALFEADGSPLRAGLIVPFEIGLMTHTGSIESSHLRVEANKLFKQAISPDLAPEQRLRVMADLHWISAHAMFDKRGSAAKSEMAVRAIGYAVGIELPPFASGIVPDLEAFLTPREEYIDRYPQMFIRHPLTDPLVEGIETLRLRMPANDEVRTNSLQMPVLSDPA